ncbi:hypothetical protein WA588_006408, partial [Blastocystis sp. NMH]
MWAKPAEVVDDFTEGDSEGHILRVNGKPFIDYLAEKGIDIRDIEIADKEFYLKQLEERQKNVKESDEGTCGLTPESCSVSQESEHTVDVEDHVHQDEHSHEHDHDDHHHHESGHSHHHHHHGHSHQHKASSELVADEFKHPYLAVALTTVSAMAATVGGAFVVFAYPPSSTLLGLMLAFSAGIMLYISYMDIMVHAQLDLSMGEANCWMFVGMVGFLALTLLIPEMDDEEESQQSDKANDKELDKGSETISQSSPSSQPLFQSSSQSHQQRSLRMTGLVTALGISLHNFPEGLVVFNATVVGVCKLPPPSSFSLAYLFQYLTQCTGRGLVVALAIAIHNIPEGIAVALPLYYSTHSKWEAMKWCLLSSICEPLAAILFGVFFHAFLTERLMAIMNAIVAGIMIILCVFELIPSALQFTSAKNVAIGTIVGQVVMFVSLYFLIE